MLMPKLAPEQQPRSPKPGYRAALAGQPRPSSSAADSSRQGRATPRDKNKKQAACWLSQGSFTSGSVHPKPQFLAVGMESSLQLILQQPHARSGVGQSPVPPSTWWCKPPQQASFSMPPPHNPRFSRHCHLPCNTSLPMASHPLHPPTPHIPMHESLKCLLARNPCSESLPPGGKQSNEPDLHIIGSTFQLRPIPGRLDQW
jgi:hypothetical protein